MPTRNGSQQQFSLFVYLIAKGVEWLTLLFVGGHLYGEAKDTVISFQGITFFFFFGSLLVSQGFNHINKVYF